ncbi:hypothetical protein DSO57_1006471 [Entomophthora muscae]|uniref:Uncharacterized protein n=1 Tax=Entomophthora muscae TaxID=34485 RepID=A0ACC2USZ8_9FUNG|nr:hypothetical protein DSO57_1006471 [Entomophthora muscae]
MLKSKKLTESTPSTHMKTKVQAIPIEKRVKDKKSKKRSNKESEKEVSQPETQTQPKNDVQNDQPTKKIKKKKETLKVQSNIDNKIASFTASTKPNVSKDFEATSRFFKVTVKLYITLAPCYVDDLTTGISEFLNSYLMRYLDPVQGIVLSHNETKLLQDKGVILYDSPHINFWISTKFLVWRPTLGSRLRGTVQLQSVDHISLLLHGTFNAVILATDIPGSQYEWVENSDENEGEWVNSATKQPLADNGALEFYVKR